MDGLTQEQADAVFAERERARKQAIAEQAEADNNKLSYKKDYRGIVYYRTQFSSFVVPDAPVPELSGQFTSAVQLHRLIDNYLDKQ